MGKCFDKQFIKPQMANKCIKCTILCTIYKIKIKNNNNKTGHSMSCL